MFGTFDQEGEDRDRHSVYGKPAPDLLRPKKHKSQVFLWLINLWEEVASQNKERFVLWLPVAFAFGAGVTCSVRANDRAFLWVGFCFACLFGWSAALVIAQQRKTIGWAFVWTALAALTLLSAAFSGGGAAGLLKSWDGVRWDHALCGHSAGGAGENAAHAGWRRLVAGLRGRFHGARHHRRAAGRKSLRRGLRLVEGGGRSFPGPDGPLPRTP